MSSLVAVGGLRSMSSASGPLIRTSQTTARCPACGQPFEVGTARKCALCGYIIADERATSEDTSPYAVARADGERGWHRMCRWVWFAGPVRLKHMALIRASRASVRFARINTVLLALGLALFLATTNGWRWVTQSIALDPHMEPRGIGWLKAASVPSEFLATQLTQVPATLWWNPVQSIIAFDIGCAVSLIALWLLQTLTRVGATLALQSAYRNEKRMTAALHYGTAWLLPILLGVLIACLRVISFFAEMRHWSWWPPRMLFELSAAVMVAFGAVLWWYWLIRLGMTAPPSTRVRVVAFLAIGPVVLLSVIGFGWLRGLDEAYRFVFENWKLMF